MKYRILFAFFVTCACIYRAHDSLAIQLQDESRGSHAAVYGLVLPAPGSHRLPRGVSVTLSSVDQTERETLVLDGAFSFTDISEQNYELIVNCPGHRQVRVAVPRSSFVNGISRLSVALGTGLPPGQPFPIAGTNSVDLRQLAIPDRAIREYEKGSAAFGVAKLDKAVLHLRRAVECAPAFVEAINKAAAAYLRIGDFDNSEKMFLKSLGVKQENFPARKGLGYICLASGRFREAIDHLSAACAFAPDDAECHGWLGGALYQTAQYDQAEPELRRALELDPRLDVFSQLLAKIRDRKEKAGSVKR